MITLLCQTEDLPAQNRGTDVVFAEHRYEGRVTKGGILLSVHSDDSEWTKRAKAILERTGAEDISSTGETKGDVQNSDKPMPRAGVN